MDTIRALEDLASLPVASKIRVGFTKEVLLQIPEEKQRMLLKFKLDSKSKQLLVLHGVKDVALEAARSDDFLMGRYIARKDVSPEEAAEVADCDVIIEAISWSRALLGDEKLHALLERSKALGCEKSVADFLLFQASIDFIKKHFDELFPHASTEALQRLLFYKSLPLSRIKQIVAALDLKACKRALSWDVCGKARELLRRRLENGS